MRGGNMRDPMKPVVPLMAEEMENLENLKKYMDDNEYHAYLEKRALEALVRYRAKSNLEDLEEMQFFMHRITHNIIEGVKKTEELNAQKEQIRRLNIMASMQEGYDG
jgi:predicted house-cleaning noncanonical NTP pyrophosphatase (MazG superfamily)